MKRALHAALTVAGYVTPWGTPLLWAYLVHTAVWSAIRHDINGGPRVLTGAPVHTFAYGMAYGTLLGGGYALCAFFFARGLRDVGRRLLDEHRWARESVGYFGLVDGEPDA
jgi:hypothetical protein